MQTYKEACDAVTALLNDAMMLTSGYLRNQDLCIMTRYAEKLFAMLSNLLAENRLAFSVSSVEAACRSIEDEKSRFLAEKALKDVRGHYFEYKKAVILPNIDHLIEVSKMASFEDYRGIEFQKDMKKTMLDLKEWVENTDPDSLVSGMFQEAASRLGLL